MPDSHRRISVPMAVISRDVPQPARLEKKKNKAWLLCVGGGTHEALR